MEQIESEAMLLSAKSDAYDFQKNGERSQGVSHRARFNVRGEIFSFKVTPEVVKSLEPMVGKTATLKYTLTSPKENFKVTFNSFD